jgi:hypothetical protein
VPDHTADGGALNCTHQRLARPRLAMANGRAGARPCAEDGGSAHSQVPASPSRDATSSLSLESSEPRLNEAPYLGAT